MLETLINANKKLTDNRANAITRITGYSHISGCMWTYGGNYYQYGGKNASYANDNTFRKWNPTTQLWDNITVTATDGVTGVVEVPTLCLMQGNIAWIAGRNSGSTFSVMAVNMTTMQRTTWNNGGGFAHNGGPSTGVTYNPDANVLYLKATNSSFVLTFNLTTKAFSNLVSGLNATRTAHEALAYKNGYVYMIGGYTSSYVTVVTRITVSNGALTDWDTLGGDFTSVWQNAKSVAGVFRYCTWANGLNGVVNYVVYEPETKKQMTRKFGTGLGYRNATFQSVVPGGVIYGGGTTVAVGATNWQTAGRIDGAWLISDPDITGYY